MTTSRHVTCCIAGGGPAGMMLGFLLARAGVDVVVLEKHQDFLRDFRGDTIHPSTLDVLRQLGLLDRFRPLLQNEITTMDVVVRGRRVTPVDFSRLRGHVPFLGLLPQWDFLDFLAREGATYPTFSVQLGAEVTGLLWEGGRARGVLARGQDGAVQRITADLVVGADGRDSAVRRLAGIPVRERGVGIDVLWFRLAKPQPAPPATLAYFSGGDMVLTVDRGAYYQGGMVVAKGSFAQIRRAGLPALRRRIVQAAPVLEDVVEGLQDWEQVKLLSVQVNRAPRWDRPGVLLLGDAAHAMSPAFGVGVNFAVQDAVAAANLLAGPLREGCLTGWDVARVQRRRELPIRLMQPLQLAVHRFVARPGGLDISLPQSAVARAVGRLAAPVVQRLAAELVGVGFRPESMSDAA